MKNKILLKWCNGTAEIEVRFKENVKKQHWLEFLLTY